MAGTKTLVEKATAKFTFFNLSLALSYYVTKNIKKTAKMKKQESFDTDRFCFIV